MIWDRAITRWPGETAAEGPRRQPSPRTDRGRASLNASPPECRAGHRQHQRNRPGHRAAPGPIRLRGDAQLRQRRRPSRRQRSACAARPTPTHGSSRPTSAPPTVPPRLSAQAVAASGRLDVLVNNAARVIDKPALEMTEEDWDDVLDVNLKGAFLCSQHAARQMLTQDDGGVIVNIGASTGIRGRRNGVNTCASKAGLMIMTQCLALELAPQDPGEHHHPRPHRHRRDHGPIRSR